MTKGTRTFLILSIVLICGGIILLSTGLLLGGTLSTRYSFSNGKLNIAQSSDEIVEDTLILDEFDYIEVDTTVVDINVVKGNEYSVSYRVREDFKPEISVDDTRLTITSGKESIFFNFGLFSFQPEKEHITICVPEGIDDTLRLNITGSTADVTVNDLENYSLSGKIKLSTGDISLENLNIEELNLENTTGDKKLQNCNVDSMLTLKSSTGETTINDCSLAEFASKSSTGDVKINNSSAYNLDIEASTGNITINDITADAIKVSTSTGSVKMEIPGTENDYNFMIKTSTGDIRVGSEEYEKNLERIKNSSKTITVKTSTGDIKINFTE